MFKSLRNFFLKSENPKEESPLESEKKLEPEISPDAETSEKIGQLDGKIEESKHLLGGLGRVARQKGMLAGPEAYDEIYARKEIGRSKLNSIDDAQVFESADSGLKVRNAILESLGAGGSKHALKGRAGLVDSRKLKSEQEGKEQPLSEFELKAVVEELGFKPEEIDLGLTDLGFAKKYVKSEKGTEKVILTNKTEQEMDQKAGEILARRLNDLEKTTGPDLIKQKQGLEEFKKLLVREKERSAESKKLKEQNNDVLDEASLEKLDGEEVTRQGMIGEKQEALNLNLEFFRSPLLEQQKGVAEAIKGLSPILAEATVQEKAYDTQIKGLQDKIRRIKGAKPLAEVLGDEIQAWEGQEVQAKVNLENFRKKKVALNMRLAELKSNQVEVDRTLARINNIGKTPAELKKEKEEKQQAELKKEKEEKQQAEKRLEKTQTAANVAPEQPRQARKTRGAAGPTGDESAGFKVKIKHNKIAAAAVPGQVELDKTDDDSSGDDETAKQMEAEQTGRAKIINEIDQAVNEFGPRSRTKARIPRVVEAAAETARPTKSEQGQENRVDDGGTDDYAEQAADERRKIELEQQRVDLERFREIRQGKFKPRGGMRELKRQSGAENIPKVAPVAGMAVPETEPEGNRGTEKREAETVRPVKFWLNAIFGGKLNAHDDKIMRRHFKLGGKFDKFQEMTSAQAERALMSYQIEAEGFRSDHSRQEARKKIGKIVEQIDDYDREEKEEAKSSVIKATGTSAAEGSAEAVQKKAEEFAGAQAGGTEIINARRINIRRGPQAAAVSKKTEREPSGEAKEQLDGLAAGMDEAIVGKDSRADETGRVARLRRETKSADRVERVKPLPKARGQRLRGETKSKDGKENLSDRGGANRRRGINEDREREAREAAREAGTKADESAQITGNNGEAPDSLNGKKIEAMGGSPAFNILEDALKQAEAKTVVPPAVESAPNSEKAGAGENSLNHLVEAVKNNLQEVKNNRRVKRAIERNFGSTKIPKEIKTEAELIEAVIGYIKDMGGEDGKIARQAAEQMINKTKEKLN